MPNVLYSFKFREWGKVPNDAIASKRYNCNYLHYIIFCDNIKYAVFLLNVMFGRLFKDGK